jgi:hypothetical protein
MRMPGKSGEIIFGNVVAEIIEQEEWVEIFRVSEAESTAKVNTRALKSWFGLDELFYWPNRHGAPVKNTLMSNEARTILGYKVRTNHERRFELWVRRIYFCCFWGSFAGSK